MRQPCTGDKLLMLLQGSDWWIQRANADGVDSSVIETLVDQIISPSVQEIVSSIAGPRITTLIQIGEQTPIKWGNWYFGTPGYIAITSGARQVMYCEIISNTDAQGKFAYIFAITSSEERGPNDTNYRRDMLGIPEFAQDNYVVDTNCPITENS